MVCFVCVCVCVCGHAKHIPEEVIVFPCQLLCQLIHDQGSLRVQRDEIEGVESRMKDSLHQPTAQHHNRAILCAHSRSVVAALFVSLYCGITNSTAVWRIETLEHKSQHVHMHTPP